MALADRIDRPQILRSSGTPRPRLALVPPAPRPEMRRSESIDADLGDLLFNHIMGLS